MTVTDLPAHNPGRPARRFAGPADRWQPTRAGLLNVWQYVEETFEFENGRLVLFGANGSGKTMALELLFPYLLDANASPSRLSTAGGHERGGLWNRVCGYDDGSSRVGYLWAEFARTATGGQVEHFTCGTRLAAKPGGGGSHCWFTTTLRVGGSLALLDDNRVPLTPQVLRERVGQDGTVWGDDAGGYRNAIRSCLYAEFSPDAYSALIDGLLAVRKQSVTEDLNPDRLHRLLTDGLPGLDSHELDHVARGFEQLDSRRDTIGQLRDAVTASQGVARRVRSYSRMVLRAVSEQVTNAQSTLDGITRRRTAAEEQLQDATDALATLEAEKVDLEGQAGTVDARIQAVRESKAFSHISELDQERRRAGAAAEHAKALREIAGTRKLEHDRAVKAAATAEQQAAAVDRELSDAYRAAATAGRDVGVDVDAADDHTITADRYRTAAELREQSITEVRAKLAAVAEATSRRDQANDQLAQLEKSLSDRQATAKDAARRLGTTVDEWVSAVGSWASGLVELGPSEPHLTVLDEIGPHLDTVDLAAVTAAAVDAHRRADRALTQERTRLEGQLAAVEAEIVDATARRDVLRDATVPEPPQRAGWRAAPAPGRRGAPLWALLAPLDLAVLDGVEAALDAAGLLDAWVDPDGPPVPAGDLQAVPTGASDGPTIADVVAVDTDACAAAGVDPAVISRIVAAVGYGEGPDSLHVSSDGTFGYGPVRGTAPARPARHIGTAARERARLEQLAAVEAVLAELTGGAGVLSDAIDAVDRRSDLARDEAGRVPDGKSVTEARAHVELSDALVEDATAKVSTAADHAKAADRQATAAVADLARTASATQLPTTPDGLDTVARKLRALRDKAADLKDAARRSTQAHARAVEQRELAGTRGDELATAEHAANTADADSVNVAARLQQLEASVGPGARKAAADLQELTSTKTSLAEALAVLDGDLRAKVAAQAKAETTLQTATDDAEEAFAARDAATAQFVAVVDAGIHLDADIDIGAEDLTTVTGVRNATRTVNRIVAAAPSVQRLSRELTAVEEERFASQKVLAGRAELSVTEVDAGNDVTMTVPVSCAVAVVDGTQLRAAQMTDRFYAELARAEAELAEREAALFEQIFTGSLRTHLASRLRAAQHLVDSMNDLLSGIRSASGGVQVSLRWDVTDDVEDTDTLRRIKSLLLRQQHSAEDRELLHGFLSRRIDQVRHDDRSLLSWRDALEALFDYRRWHRFHVHVRHDRFGDRPVPFTSRKVSLSAGEKALVLSLPLFAAVSSHYMPRDDDGVAPACPRLVLLDEVFPKNDRANKRQILGLLTELDLDCVLTSDKDRCDYETIDGIAIAVIAKDGDLSYSTRLVWNGHAVTEAAPQDLTGPADQPALL